MSTERVGSIQNYRGTVFYADTLYEYDHTGSHAVVRLAEFDALQKSRDDLLAALREVERCAISLCDDDKLPDDTCPADLLDMVRAAIAKV